MRTLVIHPKDPSTDFLSVIYEGIEDKMVLRGGKTKDEVREFIKEHDRIIMLGHGVPAGLISGGQFIDGGLIIGESMVEVLSEKKECLYIWCNADKFVNNFNLKGFYSGMFISEVSEASWYRIITNQEVIDESNNRFSELVGQNINKSSQEIYTIVKEQYGLLSESNPVASYNQERLYLRI